MEGSSVVGCMLTTPNPLSPFFTAKLRTAFPRLPCSPTCPCVTTFLLMTSVKGCVQLPRHLIKIDCFPCPSSLFPSRARTDI